MKWSPPPIERCRFLAMRCLLLGPVSLVLMAGCGTVPKMRSSTGIVAYAAPTSAPLTSITPLTAAEQSRLATMPAVPEFDTPVIDAVASVQKPTATDEKTSLPADTNSVASSNEPSPKMVEPASPPKSSSSPPVVSPSVPNSEKNSSPSVAAINPSLPSLTKELSPPASKVAMAEKAAETGAQKLNDKPVGFRVTAPTPFEWERDGKSAGGRPFQIASPGDDGYRTLVVGSVGGNDPIALELVERLARRLHEDSVILGGFDSTIIRTLNPDGEVNKSFLNQKEQYINEGFPKTGDAGNSSSVVEVAYMLKLLTTLQPQRVVHIRSVRGTSGVIAASESCQASAKEAASWLNFKLVMLPESARVAGSMERYVSTTGSSDMITFGIPEATPKSEVWDRYGDTLLNLLLGDDTAAREMARTQSQKSSADRRNQSPEK